MRDFFAREDVQALQAVQKTSRYGSVQHRKAFESMKALALEVGAAQFFGEY